MWLDAPTNENQKKSWQEANEYCESLKFEGYDDWYLPSVSEFKTLQENNFKDNFHYNGYKYWTRSTQTLDTNYFDDGSEGYLTVSGDWISKDSATSTNNFLCVRGKSPIESSLYGHWAFVDNGKSFDIDDTTFLKNYEVIDQNQIKITTDDGKSRYLIRAGIADVALEGEIAQVQGADATKKAPSLGKLKSVVISLKNKVTQTQKQVKLVKTDLKEQVGKVKDAKAEVKEIYAEATKDGRLKIPKSEYLTMPTGKTLIELEDDLKNKASFIVSVVGEQTDVGVMSVTNQKYNFKSFLENGNDWIYFGYNDGEDEVTYTKRLNICNVGSVGISGVSFKIELDSNASDINRTFSTSYDGSAIGFEKDECKNYDVSFALKRPQEQRDIKINITIKDNMNDLEWYDYASLKVSPYRPLKLYFLSNQKELNGFLVAPGRQLLRVQFQGSIYYGKDNFVRVPLVPTNRYDVVVSTPDLGNEDVYMIGSGVEPDTTKMKNFTDVKNYEPNNQESNATQIPLLEGSVVSYLSVGDIDFYTLTDIPFIKQSHKNVNKAMPIVVSANTKLNSTTLSAITLHDSDDNSVEGNISLQDDAKTVLFTPTQELESGKYKLVISSALQSTTGYALTKEQQVSVDVYTTHIKKLVLDENQNIPSVDPIYEYKDGITKDYATNLMWQDNSDIADMNWSEANKTCANLDLGGYDDWRLPHFFELTQAVKIVKNDVGDYYSQPIFTNKLTNEYFWSDRVFDSGNNSHWNLEVKLYFSGYGGSSDDNHYTRCVRGGYEHNLTRDDDKKVVIDSVNNLVWEDDANVTATYEDAQTHCSELSLGGYDDWRVPTLFELETIYSYAHQAINVDSAFKYFANDEYYWSATKFTLSSNEHYIVRGSYSSVDGTSQTNYIRCVRGGE